MRLTLGRLLDRGWSADWVMVQPLYRLTEMLLLMAGDDRRRSLRGQESEYVGRSYALPPETVAQLKAKREAQRAVIEIEAKG